MPINWAMHSFPWRRLPRGEELCTQYRCLFIGSAVRRKPNAVEGPCVFQLHDGYFSRLSNPQGFREVKDISRPKNFHPYSVIPSYRPAFSGLKEQ
jgi:hypothetical protein